MKMFFLMILACAGVLSSVASPVVLSVDARQNWPWDPSVKVVYDLVGTAGHGAAISVTARNGGQPLLLPAEALSGELVAYSDGRHLLEIDLSKIVGAGAVLADFSVSLSAVETSLDESEVFYKVLDLTDGSVTDVTRGDLMSGELGSVTTNYSWTSKYSVNVPLDQFLIWTEPASNDTYKTSKLVLRRCKPGTFKMGAGDVSSAGTDVTISKEFYIGIFEMTQNQCERLIANKTTWYFTNPTCGPTRPAGNVTFDAIRGDNRGGNWPLDRDASVDEGSYLAALRALTKDEGWDIPTEAQWEYAARAATTTFYNTGYNNKDVSVLNTIGRNSNNSGTAEPTSDTSVGTAAVASYLPNAWGLYDCHGNVWEWTRDRYDATIAGGTDPLGPGDSVVAKYRVCKGGGYLSGHGNIQGGTRGKQSRSRCYDPSKGDQFDLVDAVGWRIMWQASASVAK